MLFLAILLIGAAALLGCNRRERGAYGDPVDQAAAVPLSEILGAGVSASGELVTVSGRIGEVCRSAGCWFTLMDATGERSDEIFVDLKAGASFTVSRHVQGRDAVVLGRLVGSAPDLQIQAVGLVVE